MELKRVIMKIKTKMLDFLPVVALVLWAIINVSTAYFYTPPPPSRSLSVTFLGLLKVRNLIVN